MIHDETSNDSAGLVVLDIRTPEEFNEARLADAIMVDFYADDFADQLDALDKDVPYVMYCRSGNRSSEAVTTMKDLGFVEVYEIDGGIVNWSERGYPIES
jgi:rhodanese-related sulfurtransferase